MDVSLSPVMEDYIEVIYQLLNHERVARVTDIAKKMKVTMATVTSALRKLSAKELIIYSPYSTVLLTPNGQAIAEKISMRHEVLGDFFQSVLAIPPDVAMDNACRIEHQIDDVLFDRLIKFVEFLKKCPNVKIKWHDNIGFNCMGLPQPMEGNCGKCKNSFNDGDIMEEKSDMVSSVSLCQLAPGEKAIVVEVIDNKFASRRMLELGLVGGVLVEVERIAPMGDPIDIKIRGYRLSLRKDDAKNILVEKI